MSRIRSKNTKPELLVKLILDKVGVNYEYQPKGIQGKPDFKMNNILIFIDGCFWHGCPEHFKLPKTNREFWEHKITTNINHDKFYNWQLNNEGWIVRRIWEHDLKLNKNKEK